MRKRSKFLRLLIIFILVTAILFCAVLALDRRMRRVICDYSASVGETVMIHTVDQVISDLFYEENIKYSDIVTLSRDEQGNVTSLEVSAPKINYIKSKISVNVAEQIAKQEKYDLLIPVGTIIGNEYTIGRGPDVKFKMQITTTVIADFESKFYSAGINQVLHQIHIKVKMNGHTVVPWYRSAFSAETSVIAAQTVIVGMTPDAYTNVIEAGSDATQDIFDFGAY